jgi:hypothetical protein
MPKGGFGGMPGGNMQSMMKQMQKMQTQMMKAREDVEQKTLEVTSGGGAVKVVISGKKEITDLVIKPEVIDPDDIEMLQDLLITAVNEAVRQADELMEKEMGKYTGGINLPF